MIAASYPDVTLYRRLLRQVRPYWLHIAGCLLLSLLSTPFALLTPLPLQIAVDSVIGARPLPAFLDGLLPAAATRSDTAILVLVAGLVVAIALLRQLQELGSSLLRTYTSEKLVLSFRAQLFRHVQRLSLSYHDSQGTSDSTYRIQYDAASIQYIVIDGFIPFITAGFTLAGMIYVTARLDWQLALVALAVSPVLFLLSRAYRRRLRGQSREVKQLESFNLSVVQEVLTAARVVKAFGQEDREEHRFVHHSREGMWARVRLAFVEGGFGLLVGLTTGVGTAAALFIGVRHVQSGSLTLGELLLVMGYLAQLYEPLKTIGRKAASLQSHLASAERAFSLLDEAPGVIERPNARPLARASGAIVFRHVSFAYGKDRPVLHDISFEIGPGTRLGIAGTTGAGKTTLVSLLARFYDPSDGQILLDGVDLRDYKLADLRNQFAIVLQEPVLFSTTIAENIAYARPGASYHDIIAAAKAANAHEFIVCLPQGYDTLVGERGLLVSGGERQRIALARAFLKDAPILILDEPTSSVDVRTEAMIMEAMERLMHGRTTFIITHRLSMLAGCDVLLVIEHGRIATVTSDSGVSQAEHAPTDAPRPGPPREIEQVIKRTSAQYSADVRALREELSQHMQATGSTAPGKRPSLADTPRLTAGVTPMLKHEITEGMATDLLAHPAVKAWSELQPERVEPEGIRTLKEPLKSAVYRLEGVGRAGAAIIAKRCPQATAVIERTIYTEVLPHLPITALHYYGCVEEPDGKFCWLFLEDAGKEEYSPSIADHRALAAWWLGLLHTTATRVAAAVRLPDRGPRHYLEHLQAGRDTILRNLANPALQADDLAVLMSIISQYEVLESRWNQVEGFCEGLPWTLVHGDFTGQNVRVRTGQSGKALLAFDWELAGWGVPATDLAQSALLGRGGFSANPDVATYWSIVRDHWPRMDRQTLERLASCGTMFRSLAAINWKAHRLAFESVEWGMLHMRIYQAELVNGIQALRWED